VSKPRIIVWDLDGTLGRFEGLNGRGDSPEPIAVQVRPHLRDCLERLAAVGFRHSLLTLATPFYAELVLHGLGLRDLFVRVEGLGQRGKGDAAGLAREFDIAEADRPHQMLFVGDHPLHDEPRDPRVVFHLEPFGLTRSARDLAALVSVLLELGGGSLAEGFAALGRRRPWWKRLGRALPLDCAVQRQPPGLAPVLMMRRRASCPVLAFARPPERAESPEERSFIPDEVGRTFRAP
jgi:hypothetical protein